MQTLEENNGIDIEQRLARIAWDKIEQDLDEYGCARTSPILTPTECNDLIGMYVDDKNFRSRVDMARQGFGVGEYKYFTDPLPPVVQALREGAYNYLVGIANRWMEELALPARYETTFQAFLERCIKRGQTKPTPLLLRYETDGYNNLHQDVYGALLFPFQMTFVLSRLGIDYTGGEFLLIEQQPRSQWRGTSITLELGEAVIFPVRDKPAVGANGYYKANLRHGVSRLTSGTRYTLGVIFHNAQ